MYQFLEGFPKKICNKIFRKKGEGIKGRLQFFQNMIRFGSPTCPLIIIIAKVLGEKEFMIQKSLADIFQVTILGQSDCQGKVLGNETIQSSMLCAGGKGKGTHKVRQVLKQGHPARQGQKVSTLTPFLDPRVIVGDLSLYSTMASTLWPVSPATDSLRFLI